MNRTTFKVGMSSAASWAWGTSLIMGQQIAQQKGPEAFWIWAIANSLTLAIFLWLHNHDFIKPEIYRSKLIKAIAIVIQLFCLVVQLNFINQILNSLIDDSTLCYAITFATGAFFVLAMYTRGLKASIFTDVAQWSIALVTICIILAVGITQDVPRFEFAVTGGSEYLWAIWSAIILIAGPMGDVQHWQRAEADPTKKGYYLGAFLFFIYMCLIYAMACFHFNDLMNWILLITVLCVTTSTIDSIAVATHEMGGKKIGTAVCLFICAVWGVLADIGMVTLWSSFGVIRVVFAVAILTLPFCLLAKKSQNALAVGTGAIAVTALTLVVFIWTKSITVTNLFGMACAVVAFGLLVYLAAVLTCGKDKGLFGELDVGQKDLDKIQ